MKAKNGRKCQTRGVSLSPEVFKEIEERIETLRPRVKGFSHYVQLLIDWDIHRKEGTAKLPFEKPLIPFNNSVQISAVMN